MHVTYDFHEFFRKVKMISDNRRLSLLGLTPRSPTGFFSPEEVEDLIELCMGSSEFHIVSDLGSGIFVNRYDPRGKLFRLAEGVRRPDYMLNAQYEHDLILAGEARK